MIQEYQLQLTERANTFLSTPLNTRNGKLIVPTLPGIGVNEASLAEVSVRHRTGPIAVVRVDI